MKGRAARACALLLTALLTAAVGRPDQVGFADLPRLVAAHPLHAALASYDRQIAALRDTQGILTGREPGTVASTAASAVGRDAAAARSSVATIAARGSARDLRQEREALAAIATAPRSGATLRVYRNALDRETGASLSAYAAAIDARTTRALAALQQQLREKESTYAFDLARKDSVERFLLRLKLRDLHLDATTRTRYRAELSAIDRHDAVALAELRRDDAAAIAREQKRLLVAAAAAKAKMTAELRSKASANLGLRLHVAQAADVNRVAPDVAARLRSFASSYGLPADAAAISGGLHAASNAIAERFAALAQTDRRSGAETALQLRRLEDDRAQLYRAMVARIGSDARQLARQRGLRRVVLGSGRPTGSVDLTSALLARERSF